MKIILLVVGTLSFVNVAVLFLVSSVHHGHIIQVAVSIGIILYALLYNRMPRKIHIATGIACAIPVAFVVFLAVYGNMNHVNYNEDVVIILGAGLRSNEEPSSHLESRLDTALAYLSQNPDALVIVCGGLGVGRTITEAESMARYLQARGIPPERIILEGKSTTTYENLVFAKEILDEHFPDGFRAVLITNDFHIRRAATLARHIGIDVNPLGAPTPWYSLAANYLREILATINMRAVTLPASTSAVVEETREIEEEVEIEEEIEIEEEYRENEEEDEPEEESVAFVPPVRVPVLAYHSIMSREFYYPINVPNPWILLDEVFLQHMEYLYKNNFTPMTVQQFMDFLFYDKDLPERPVVLTFDDGYLDNYLFAAPIMRQFGFTGMMFIITGAISETTPAMAVYPSQFMSPAEIAATMDVFEYGSHTHDMHRAINGRPPLTFESVENIRADIRQSFEAPLTFTTGFAYPHGRHSANAIAALQAEGVRFAFATHLGYVYRDTDPFRLPRFSVKSDWTMEMFSEIVWGEWRD